MTAVLTDWDRALAATAPEVVGTVRAVVGLTVEVLGTGAAVGELVRIGDDVLAEVVATDGGTARCMPLGPTSGLRAGMPVRPLREALNVPVGTGLLGRVLDGLGRPIDGRGPLRADAWVPVDGAAPHPLERSRVDAPLDLGVRVLDTLVTVGRGQRLGLFAGSGVGKSSLLSMIARGTDAEVSVIALVGERGREVREFLEDDLGPEGLARSVVVVATSDQPPLVRLRSAFVATRIAEHLRDTGAHAVLMMDSLTRVAMAQREIGLSVGEPPATRGYPPSTFALLAQLLERAGTGATGSVTGLYTVLVDGDDHNEPIADAARSILDGHVVLDRRLAVAGHFPSVDALGSISRVASRVTSAEQRDLARRLRAVMAARRQAQDLLDVGAYVAGSNPLVDAAVTHGRAIDQFLQQGMDDVVPAQQAWAHLSALVGALGDLS
ncbi:EscN/YscN/HrcN family type III secretion system ATPase [Cellulomonas chitinilytica]|uniref:EscN/YscN/HrcN family type III secretion system ATPase n=1 Tax=Cellulomonas chitinilytica TaxID=398759 RepID=A0A919P5I8_9CELL|nr:FliI/YscN family ATPase [Cellulomonas chitinilytica]GIG22620.1 EscN/YscN/HrcN family type III secretion system ATPase [Cellulomonas chitinilytica]